MQPELKALALAVHLDVALEDIEEASYGNNQYEVNPRRVREGEPPSYYDIYAAHLHALLQEAGLEHLANDVPLTRARLMEIINVLSPAPNARTYSERLRELLELHLDDKLYQLSQARFPSEIHYYINGLYFLLDADPHTTKRIDWHVYALRAAFDGQPIEDVREWRDTDDGSYMVLTEEEANQAWDDELENYLDEAVMPEIPADLQHYFDREAWMRDARQDGRGHAINSYDGEEDEIDISCGSPLDGAIRILRQWYIEQEEPEPNPINYAVLDDDEILEMASAQFGCDPSDAEVYFIYRTS